MKKLLLSLLTVALALGATASPDIPEAKAGGRPTQSQARANVAQSGSVELLRTAPRTRGGRAALDLRQEFRNADLGAMRMSPSRVTDAVPEIEGFVFSLDAWIGSSNKNIGLYKLPRTGAGNVELVYSIQDKIPDEGDIYTYLEYDGKIFASCLVSDDWGYQQDYSMLVFDAATGALLSSEASTYNEYMINAAVDPVTNTVYAVTGSPFEDWYGETHYKYGTLTIEGNSVIFNSICNFDYYPKVMVFDNDGQLYMLLPARSEVSSEEDAAMVVRLNKETGTFDQIGPLPVKAEYRSGAVVDRTTGRCYWNASGMYITSLYEVDLANATATKLFDYDCGLSAGGLRIAAAAASGTPGRVENLTLSFPEASLTGNVSFDVPAVEETSVVDYVVQVDNVEVARKECAAPSHVDFEYTSPSPGLHTFAVYLVNGELTGPKANASMFLGHGTPNAPEVSTTWNDGIMTISWEPVSTTADGGYIDPAEVRYTVVCDNDGTVVAENIAATSVTAEVPVPESITRYTYTVSATYRDKTVNGTSNVVSVGYMPIPYINGFDSLDQWDELTIINANGDSKTWTYYSNNARYSWNSAQAADDWLMTPPVRTEAGKAYKISFTAHGSSNSYPERLEVKYGNSTAVSAMTGTILEPTILAATAENGKYEFIYIPEETSPFVLGFHAISDKDMMNLILDDIRIDFGPSLVTPGEPTAVTVTPDPDGELKVSISVDAPAVDLSGAALTDNVDLFIKRGDYIVKQANVAPGTTVTAEDVLAVQGEVTYTIYAANAAGDGTVVSSTVFVGVKKPVAPQDIVMTEEGNTGKVTISWPAVNKDVDGNTINPAKVMYKVYGFDAAGYPELIEGPFSGTSYTMQAVSADTQDFVQYALSAETAGGESDLVATAALAVGKPYEELTESFGNGRLAHIFLIKKLTPGLDMTWSLYNDNGVEGIPSQDGDNGYAAANARNVGASGALETGKVIVPSDIENPALSFHTFNIIGESNQPDENLVEIAVAEAGSNQFTTVFSRSVDAICAGQPGWGKGIASLAAFKGKTVVIRIIATVNSYVWTAVDNLKIENMTGHDLRLVSITAPSSVRTGADYTVDVKVSNEGANAAEAYSVELYADDELVATEACADHAIATTKTVSFAQTMHPLAEQAVAFHAVLVYAEDEVADNNTSEKTLVAPVLSVLPAVTDLSAVRNAEGAVLTWSEPDLSQGVTEVINEGVEEAEAWAHSLEGWTFVDADDAFVGGFQNMQLPGFTIGQTKASFFVFNAPYVDNNTFAAHSGDQYLASLFRADDGKVDDWAISPQLSGNAQKIRFYARSYSSQYPESIEVLASTTGIQTADFTVVRPETVVGANWELIEVQLPAGTQYFAIRSVATGSFMLMIDDITYEKAYSTADLSIVGYNIWRNGEKLNAEPEAECTFTDAAAPDSKTTYVVTTVYTAGESRGSNAASVDESGLDMIEANVSITAEEGNIIVRGAAGALVTVNAVDGRTLHSAVAPEVVRIPVAAGIYMVTVGDSTSKIIVR